LKPAYEQAEEISFLPLSNPVSKRPGDIPKGKGALDPELAAWADEVYRDFGTLGPLDHF